MKRHLFLSLLFLLCCSSVFSGDKVTVIFKNGYQQTGDFVSFDGTSLYISQGEKKKDLQLKMNNIADVLNEKGESIINNLTIEEEKSDSITGKNRSNYYTRKFAEQEALLHTRRVASIITLSGVGITALGGLTLMATSYEDRDEGFWDSIGTTFAIGGGATLVGSILYVVTEGRLTANNYHITKNIYATLNANGLTITF